MPENFGEAFGRRLRAEYRVVLASRTLQHTEATVTEVRSDKPTHERSDPLPPVDASCVAIQLRDFPVHEWWEENRRAPVSALRAGQITLYDVRRDPRFRMNNPFHSIHVALPRALMESAASECADRRIVDLQYSPGKGLDDLVLQPLLLSLRPVLARPEEASRLFVDHVTRAVATHVAVAYGHVREKRPHPNGGLSPWQQRRALELIDARLDGDVTIAELARCCGLSDSYFSHAFKHSVGVTPHRWLMQRRVEKARELLTRSNVSAAEIALSCGFANQSHFTRVFRAVVGCPPVEWRRRAQSRSTHG